MVAPPPPTGRRSGPVRCCLLVAAGVAVLAAVSLRDAGGRWELPLLGAAAAQLLLLAALARGPGQVRPRSGPPADAAGAAPLLLELRRELARSRRYGRPLAVARIPVADGAALSALVRRTDRVWADGEDVYLLLPETTVVQAEAMLARLRSQASGSLAAGARLACFPEHGLSSGALLAALGDGRRARERPMEGRRDLH